MTDFTRNRKQLHVFLLSIVISVVFCAQLYAVPASPKIVKAKQKDGSTLAIRIQGDEFFNWKTTEDGYPVVEKEGYFYYANYTASGAYTVSQERVMKNGKIVRPSSAIKKANISAFAPRVTKAQRAQRAGGNDVMTNTFPNEGDVRSLVILVDYYDVKFTVENPNQAFTNQLNQEGYSVEGATGSARDYFLANSGGKFKGQFDVRGPYTLSQPQRYYGANSPTNGGDLRPSEMIEEAVKLAYNDGVDFSEYDLNNDGYVDNIFVYYAGRSEAEGGGSDCVWPHKWNTIGQPTYNGKIVDVYACSSELRGSIAEEPIIAGIGTFCHEFSHVFGLADHYDTNGAVDGETYGLGAYDIMTSGNYNNDGNTPPLHNALERMMIGWVEPIELEKAQSVTLEPINNGTVYKMSTDIEGEFFLFENRNRAHSVWDFYIPGEGMLITHVDQSEPYHQAWLNNYPNGDSTHECFKLIVAGNVGLDYYTGWDKAPYPYVDIWNSANSNDEFSPNSKPKAQSWSKTIMPLQVTNIAKSGENITFTVGDAEVASISGNVKDSYGNYLGGAAITLTNNTTGTVYSGTSNSNGVIEFDAEYIPDGNYTLLVTADNYAPYTTTFNLKQGAEISATLYSIEQGKMREVGYHNGQFDHGVGSPFQFRPMVVLTAEMLKEHIGCAIKEVRFYASGPFEGQVIIQPGMYAAGWSPGPFEVTEGDLGWRTSNFSGTGDYGADIIIKPNTDYYVKVMVITDTGANTAIGMDNSTDESLYKYSSLLDQTGLSPETIFSGSGIGGNLLISLALSEKSLYATPTAFNTNPAYDNGISLNVNETKPIYWGVIPANANPACHWTSSDENIVKVDGQGVLTGKGKGSATVTGVSVIDPSIKMSYTVNVAAAQARAKGRAVEFDSDNGVEGLTFKFYQVEAEDDEIIYRSAKDSKAKFATIDNLAPINAENFSTSLLEEQGYISVTSGADGYFETDELIAGSKYIIKLEQDTYNDPWRATSQTTYYAMKEYDAEDPEGSMNILDDFCLFKNTIYGTERFSHYSGTPELNSVGDASQPVMYAVRIPASELTDKIGYQITHMDSYVYGLKDPYIEAIVFAMGDNGELIYQCGTAHGEIDEVPTNGQHIFEFINEEEAIVRPNTDYYVTVQMMGQIGAQSSDGANDGESNLIWSAKDRAFLPASQLGIDGNYDWQISMFVKQRDVEPITSITVSAIDGETKPCVGAEYALKADINPSTATFKEIKWSSSDEKIATINQEGVATLLKDGEVTFTATSTQYTDIKGELTITVDLKQGINGYVTNSDGNSVAGTQVTLYSATYTTTKQGALQQSTITRTSNEGYSATSDQEGNFYIDIPEGVYEIEAQAKGLMDYQGLVTVKYGLNELKVMMYQYVENLSDFMCYTAPSVDTAIGDESYNFVPFTRWDAEDLEEQAGKQITRFKALVLGAANVRFVVFTPDADEYIYRSSLISVDDQTLEMVVHDIPADKYITIEEGQDYCIGYEVADYASEVAPAVISQSSPTIVGKSDCIVYRGGITSLTALSGGESIGNWVLGFYVQDAEQQKGLDITVGQRDAVVTWNPGAYSSFMVKYGAEGGAQTAITCDDCKLELSELEAGTKYNITISGIETVSSYIELSSSSFTTLDQKTTIPLIQLKAYNGYKAGELLTLKTLNTEPTDNVEWFVNGEKLPRNTIVLEVGKHKVQCRVTRGSRSFVTTRYINVE